MKLGNQLSAYSAFFLFSAWEMAIHVLLEIEVGNFVAGRHAQKLPQFVVGFYRLAVLGILQLVVVDIADYVLRYLGARDLRTFSFFHELA